MQVPSNGYTVHALREIPSWVVRTAAVACTIVLLALSVPVIWAAVSAGLGLVALIVMAAGGVILFQAMPWAMQRLENRLLKLRKAEASANPIEQLESDVMRRAARLKAFRTALATVGGQIESIRQLLEERSHKDPGHVLERQQRALQRLVGFYGGNLDRLDRAQVALEDFRSTADRKKSEWNIAEALNVAAGMLDPHPAEYLIQDLLTDEALRTVQDRFNSVFAELDIQMLNVDAPTRTLMGDSGLERLDALTLPQATTRRVQP